MPSPDSRAPRGLSLLVFLLIAALAAGVVVWRQWQGPAVPAWELTYRPLVQQVVATGRVITPSRVQIGSEVTAVVRERRVQEGDRVAPGDVLIVLRADDIAARVREAEAALAQLVESARPQAGVALSQAERRHAQAARELERRRELFQRGLIARETIELAEQGEIDARADLEAARLRAAALAPGGPEEAVLRERLASARADLAKTTIRSAVEGTVLVRAVEPGDLVQPGRVLLEIATRGATEIEVPVDEKNLAALEVGQRARCIADAFPARPFDAVLDFIAPVVDPQRGTVDVRFRVDDPPHFLRQDMTVSVNVVTGRRERALVVPNDALVGVSGDRAAVLAVRGGVVRRVPVRLGLRGMAVTEIVAADGAALGAGDWVLTDVAAVAEGDRVRPVRAAAFDANDGATAREPAMDFE